MKLQLKLSSQAKKAHGIHDQHVCEWIRRRHGLTNKQLKWVEENWCSDLESYAAAKARQRARHNQQRGVKW